MSSSTPSDVDQVASSGSTSKVEDRPKPEASAEVDPADLTVAFEDHVIDPRGDLWVSASGTGSWGPPTPLRLKVCSRTLARASPMLANMLYGSFAESISQRKTKTAGKKWEVSLPECPPLATKQLFEIMHCEFDALQTESSTKESPPATPASPQSDSTDSEEEASSASPTQTPVGKRPTLLRQLYDLTIVADYCDAITVLKPWVLPWILTLDPEQTTRGGLMASAWVYFKLGLQDRYEAAVTQLALDFPDTSANSESKLPETLPAGFTGKHGPWPTSKTTYVAQS